MDLSLLTVALLAVLGIFAGWLGAIIGIGGGIIIVPTLVLAFGFDIRIAVATSLVAVVATSTAAGSAYVGKGTANMRLGMTLEVATTIGGIVGGLIAVLISPSLLSGLFAVLMILTAFLVGRRKDPEPVDAVADDPDPPDDGNVTDHRGWEEPGTLAGAFYDDHAGALVTYRAERVGLGGVISLFAGTVSGMLGVGGGFIKVPAMSEGMRVPIKVAAATSNFMIGVTAIASLFVYFARGYVHPYTVVPVALGVVVGATFGAAVSARVHPGVLRRILVVILVLVAVQMGLSALGVDFGR